MVKRHPRKKSQVLGPPTPAIVRIPGAGREAPGACSSPWGCRGLHGPVLELWVPGQPRSGQQRANAFVRVINSGGIVVNSLPNDCGQRAPSNRVMYCGERPPHGRGENHFDKSNIVTGNKWLSLLIKINEFFSLFFSFFFFLATGLLNEAAEARSRGPGLVKSSTLFDG